MPLNPEGPQNFGTLDDSPARMIPLVEPPELEPILAAAKERIEAAGLTVSMWAAGDPRQGERNRGRLKDRKPGLLVIFPPPQPAARSSPGRHHVCERTRGARRDRH
jgi:hypothetical protein